MFVDVHTHIDQHDPAELHEIIGRARAAGVGTIITAGTTLASSARCIEIANEFPTVLAGVGMHPADLSNAPGRQEYAKMERLAASARVVVMSEIGMEFLPSSPDRAWQEHAFRSQIQMARQHRLPIVFHTRAATSETHRILQEERAADVGGAAHYFQGTWDDATGILDLGFFISLAKPLLRLPELQDVARRLPLDHIVLETDSYPQPFKGRRERWTEPRDVPVVAAKLAELHRIDVAEVERRTTANVVAMLGERAKLIKDHPSR